MKQRNPNNPKAPNRKSHTRPQEVARTGELNEKQVMQAIQRHNESPLQLLNRPQRKLVQQHMVEELSLGFEHRRQALSMAMETRLHSIREACNHVLVTGKTHLRQQRLEYFGQVFRQVEQRMNSLSDDFLKDMDERFEKLDNFKSEAIKRREKQRLEKSVDDFLDTLDQLMDEFRSIISENISHGENQPSSTTEAHQEDFNNTSPFKEPDEGYYEDVPEEFGVNDVVEQFMEAEMRDKNWG